MKHLLISIACVFLIALNISAKNYYVSATGNDAATGTTPSTAWQTISRVNTAFTALVIAPGDSILFKRGDSFYGSLIISRSGTSINKININCYGTGNRPIINGYSTISSWNDLGNGIWESGVINAKNTLSLVTVNGRPVCIGRYPNADAPNGGYLTYTAPTTNTITDGSLPASPSWVGADILIRKQRFVANKGIVTNITSDSIITYRLARTINPIGNGILSPGAKGYGFFFENSPLTLDQFSEWYLDTVSHKLQMFFGTNNPSDYDIKFSSVDTLINGGIYSYINIANIDLEGGNMSGVFFFNGTNINVSNCDIRNMGAKGIHIFGTTNVSVSNINTYNILSNAIQVINNNSTNNVSVLNCTATNTAPFLGLAVYNDDSDNKGIYAKAFSNCVIQGCSVDTVGYTAIQFQGSNSGIKYCRANYFCYNLDDGGGVYTFVNYNQTTGVPVAVYTNRFMTSNLVTNGIGAPYGTDNQTSYLASGIYLDGVTMNVNVDSNFVNNISRNGLIGNNSNNIKIRWNTFLNAGRSISLRRYYVSSIYNMFIKYNTFYSTSPNQANFYYVNTGVNTPVPTTVQDAIKSMGVIDSNYYNTSNPVGFQIEQYASAGGALIQTSPLSLEGWQAFTGFDSNSRRPYVIVPDYKLYGLIGNNLITNGTFTSNISGWTLSGGNTTVAWDNTGKITGAGSLRMNFTIPTANAYSFIHTPIGAVSAFNNYIIQYKTLGTTIGGITNTYLRKSTSNFENLVPSRFFSFGTSIKTNTAFFTAPTTQSGASAVISIERASGTTYIDDVTLYRANGSPVNIFDSLLIRYNSNSTPLNVALSGYWANISGTIYNGTITIPPYTSILLTAYRVPIPTIQARANPSQTVQDARLSGRLNCMPPRFDDTTAANQYKGIDSCGAIVFTKDDNCWIRTNNQKQWSLIVPAYKDASYGTTGTALLVNGTVTINTKRVSANSSIMVVRNTPNGTVSSILSVPTASIIAGTSFVIKAVDSSGSINTDDQSTVNWWITK